MSTWRLMLALLGMLPLIPLVQDDHIQHRMVWFVLALVGFMWAMLWSQEDGMKRGRKKDV